MEDKLGTNTVVISISDQIKKFQAVGFEKIVETQPRPYGYQVPSLVHMCIETISTHYEEIGNLKGVDDKYINIINADISDNIDLSIAMNTLKDENYWRKCCVKGRKWENCDVLEHGCSWKQLYAETLCQELIENFKEEDILEDLLSKLNACQDYVFTLKIRQLPSHLNIQNIVTALPNLYSFDIEYNILGVGMNYDRSLFGMKISDATHLSSSFSIASCLTILKLSNCKIDDQLLRIIIQGLLQNETITNLDLSHNRITNHGARLISKLLHSHSVIHSLNIEDNQIHAEGGRYLGGALSLNKSLVYLNMKLNRLTDDGGRMLFEGLEKNSSVQEINLGSNSLATDTMFALNRVLRITTNSITTLELTGNDFTESDVETLCATLEVNTRVVNVDLRMNQLAKDSKPMMTVQQLTRKNELLIRGGFNRDTILASLK